MGELRHVRLLHGKIDLIINHYYYYCGRINNIEQENVFSYAKMQKTLKKQWFLMIFHTQCVKNEQENVVFILENAKTIEKIMVFEGFENATKKKKRTCFL